MTRIVIQTVSRARALPDDRIIRRWARAALGDGHSEAELTIRIIDLDEGRELNRLWRGREQATNVLAFPSGTPGVEKAEATTYLGDIAICAPVVRAQARAQGKEPKAHFAHMVVHGVLHLLGYDHNAPEAATYMEDLEIRTLAKLGIANPYIIEK